MTCLISTVTRLAGRCLSPTLNPRSESARQIGIGILAQALHRPQSRANPAASARSTLPAVFAIHPRGLVEPYSAYSQACGFSEGTKRSRSEVSLHNPASCAEHHDSETSQQSRKIWSALPESMKAHAPTVAESPAAYATVPGIFWDNSLRSPAGIVSMRKAPSLQTVRSGRLF